MTAALSFLPIMMMGLIVLVLFTFLGGKRIFDNRKKTSFKKKTKTKIIMIYFALLVFCAITYPIITKSLTTLDMDQYGMDFSGVEYKEDYSESIGSEADLEDLTLLKEEKLSFKNNNINVLSNMELEFRPLFIQKSDQLDDEIIVKVYGKESADLNINKRVPAPTITVAGSNVNITELEMELRFVAFTKEFPITYFTEEERLIRGSKILNQIKERVVLIKIPEDVGIFNEEQLNIIYID
ncbi:hypothetical protein ACLIA0_07560 [Bacillaceae bacterium W0354]